MKYKHNVKIDLKTGLYNCFNSHSLFCSFPCAFSFFPCFSTHLDNDESAAAGGKEKSAPFKAPVCTETWTASKSGSTTIDSHHLRTRTGPYLSGRPRVNEAQK